MAESCVIQQTLRVRFRLIDSVEAAVKKTRLSRRELNLTSRAAWTRVRMGHNEISNFRDLLDRFAVMWQQTDSSPDVFEFIVCQSELPAEVIAELCRVDLENRWRARRALPVEKYLNKFHKIRECPPLAVFLVQVEFRLSELYGLNPDLNDFAKRFPGLADKLRSVLLSEDHPNVVSRAEKSPPSQCATKQAVVEIRKLPGLNFEEATVPFAETLAPAGPEFIGRYRVIRVLGDGGFGRVYLAQDEILNRNVAVKIPHPYLVAKSADVELYLTEARIVSSLDHPFIVPVFDCGHTDDGLCYVVSKYIDGSDLATKIKRTPYTNAAAAELIATLADALHFAHVKGVVHRDVKPANILIDSQGKPYLADFGIALREEDFGKGFTRLGTIPYMSPEQLRGEGHLVDGRSDVFSLGVVLYEMITGKRPFPPNRLEHTTLPIEPKPPRQIDDAIPKELERICLKALSYRVVDRYNTAVDLASELRLFLQVGAASQIVLPHGSGLSGNSSNSNNPTSGQQGANSSIQIVPKGLRSFDRDDAGFFLELLPGARGRDGLPDSVRFWKTRIQAPESETFRVGVIYGPSGCGKSSFLKAGVIPLLSDQIVTIYLESTLFETETRLLKALRKNCPELSPELGLTESMTALRRMHRGAPGPRLLIVLDQFEQWLHSRRMDGTTELVTALRQCDGTHLQCIITVRDDFWMSVTHFMNLLEVSLVPGNNLAVVDLFDLRHARKVLTAIGQAYGILPTRPEEITKEHRSFINKAVTDLAHADQVIPVQLSLFAEMIKVKPWTSSALKSVGGAEGVGVTFLEETFNGRTAHPHHRLHQKAARAVLQSLLLDGAGGIKGAMRSYEELLVVSGYVANSREFDALLRILDSELRLITPTEPEGLEPGGDTALISSTKRHRYYHLTHDYLVPSLQEWLTRKRKETRRGRAELVLADRASVWNQYPSSRSLPSFVEWLSILFFAGRRSRRESQPFLRASATYYGSRTLLGFLLLGLAVWGTRQQVTQTRVVSIVESLTSTRCQDLPKIIESLAPYRLVSDRLLRKVAQSAENPTTKLYAAMILLKGDPNQIKVVYDGMLNAAPEDFSTIRDILADGAGQAVIAEQLWCELLNIENSAERRFRAGAALVVFDAPVDGPVPANWQQAVSFLATRLVEEIGTNSGDLNLWVSAFFPIRNVLYPELHRIYSLGTGTEIDHYAAARVLAELVADQPSKLADLILLAGKREYTLLAFKLKDLKDTGERALLDELRSTALGAASFDAKNRATRRRAHAAVALLEFGRSGALIGFLTTPTDPDLASYVEDRLSQLEVHPDLLYLLVERADPRLRASLIRSLAGMNPDRFSRGLRESIGIAVTQLFTSDPDPGVHSASEWAMRLWGMKDELMEVSRKLVANTRNDGQKWYVNQLGDTMVVFEGPIESRTGSPTDELGRDSDENVCTRTIDRTFAVCSKEVTFEQFVKLVPGYRHSQKKDPSLPPDRPISLVTWHRAAEYCVRLSEFEGIPADQWCYSAVDDPLQPEKGYWQPASNYLSRTGYRLLTEAEWEYACRAGTTTAYSWGDDPAIAQRYAFSIRNSEGHAWPVGTKCPNHFGMFDMHGNVGEWTHDRFRKTLPERVRDSEDEVRLEAESERVLRGGSAQELLITHRSANRTTAFARSGASSRIGFRVARTLSVVPAAN